MMRAIKDFQPVGAGFCKFKTGDTIQVLSAMNNDWLFGRSTVTGDEGKVPWDHVVDMEEGDDDDDDDLAGLDDDFGFPHVRGGLGDGKKILFVDDYNDTRSIAVQACMELILDNLEAGGYFEEASQIAQIDSAGVYVDGQGGTAGQGPNETMLEVIFKGHRRSNPRARDFEERTSRQLTIDDFFEYDLLVCLDRNIYEIVHHKLESYQDAGHDVSPRITPLGWYVDGKGKRKWEDIVDPLTRRGLFKSQRSQMEKCWEKVQRCTKNWLLDETGWRSVRL
jgi:protein-tyrosine-phosphatase